MPALNPTANLKMSLPEIEANQDPTQSLTPHLSPVIDNGFHSNAAVIQTPYIPSGVPANININENLVGNEHTGPAPAVKNAPVQGTTELAKSISSYMSQAEDWGKDEFKYGRTYAYGAGYKNMNFERYYTHPNFEKLGFSPYRNNDIVYNEKSSWWDDFNRMKHQFLGLAMNAVKSAGIGDLFGNSDDSADAMEKALAIGSSTKGGVGGFFTNLTLNSAYTIGIMAEITAENLALSAVEGASVFVAPETGGASLAVTGLAAARQGRNMMKLFEAIKGMGKLSKFLTELKDVDKAKALFNWSKAGEKAKGIDKFLNPFEQATEFTSNLARGTNEVDKLTNLGKTVHGFGAFYKDLRELDLAHSEARMEGASGAHNYHQQLLDEYYATNGKMAEGDAAQSIYDRSHSLRASVTLANDFLIYGTNKLTFGKLLNGFPTLGVFAKNIAGETAQNLIKVEAKQAFKKGAIEVGEASFGKKALKFATSSAYVPWSKAYLAGNISEAIQENAQDVIQDYQKARYDKINKDPSQAGYWMSMNELGGALGKQWSGQGLETLLSGFLMGSIAGGAQSAAFQGYEKVASLTSKKFKAGIEQAKANKIEQENAIVNAVNALSQTDVNMGEHNSEQFAVAKNLSNEIETSVNKGDQLKYNTYKDELEFEHLHTLAKTGKMDLFTDHINDMLKLNDEDLANAYNKSASEVKDLRERLNTRKERANEFTEEYKAITEEFKNPNNPSFFNQEKQPELYAESKANYLAHEEAVKMILYSVNASKRVSGRMANAFTELTTESPWLHVRNGAQVIGDAGASQVTLLLDNKQRSMEMRTLREEIKALEGGTPEQKKEANQKRETLEHLETWQYTLENFNTESRSNKKELTPEQKQANIQKAKVREGAIIKQADDENEYKVKKIVGNIAVVEDKDGKRKELKRDAVEVVKESTKALDHEEGDTYAEATSLLNTAFNAYMGHIAKQQGGTIMDAQLQKTFDKVRDFHSLEGHSQSLVSAINVLTNPEYLNRYIKIEAKNRKMIAEQKSQAVLDAFNKFQDLRKDNKFLNDLYDHGVWIMPEDVETYKTKPRDITYYDVVNKTIISKSSEEYKKLLQDVIIPYEQEKGIAPPVEVVAKVETPEVKKPEVKVEEEVLAVGEPITPNTPVSQIAKHDILKKRLLDAYKKFKKPGESQYSNVKASDKEILESSEFKDFLTTGTATTIINKYNTDTGRVRTNQTKPVEVPIVKPVSDYIEGSEVSFSGKVGNTTLKDVPVKVIENKGPVTDKNGDVTEHPIKLQRLDNGETIDIDLESIYSSTFSIEELAPAKPEVKTVDLQKDIDDLNSQLQKEGGILDLITQAEEDGNEAKVLILSQKRDKMYEQLKIKTKQLEDLKKTPAPTPTPVVTTTPTDIKAKKADIEKRKNKLKENEISIIEVNGTFDIVHDTDGVLGERYSSLAEAVITAEKLFDIDAIFEDEDGTWSSIGINDFENYKSKEELIKAINAKHDAELDALEGGKPIEETTGETVPEFISNEFATVKSVEEIKALLASKYADEKVRKDNNLTAEYMKELEDRLINQFMTRVEYEDIEKDTILVGMNDTKYVVDKKTSNQLEITEIDEFNNRVGKPKRVRKTDLKNKIKIVVKEGMENTDFGGKLTSQEVAESKELVDKISDVDSPEAILNDDEKGAKASISDLDNNLENIIKSCEE